VLKEQPQNAKSLESTSVKQCKIKCRSELDGAVSAGWTFEGSLFSQFPKAPMAGYVDWRVPRFSSTWHQQYFKELKKWDEFQKRRGV